MSSRCRGHEKEPSRQKIRDRRRCRDGGAAVKVPPPARSQHPVPVCKSIVHCCSTLIMFCSDMKPPVPTGNGNDDSNCKNDHSSRKSV
eukprot:6206626-Pleurochrysis_carterae.AAC.5